MKDRFPDHPGLPPRRPRLGVLLKESGQDGRGLAVEGVTPGSAAEKAGIKAGDLLTAIDGASLAIAGDPPGGRVFEGRRIIHHKLRELQPGQRVTVELLRSGQPQKVELTLTDDAFQHGPPWMMPGMELPEPPPGGMGGMRHGFGMRMFGPMGPFRELGLAPMNPDLGQYFGTQEGVLVVRAPPEAAPLKGGDVILRVDGKPATSPFDTVRQLRGAGPNQSVTVEILRQHARQTVTLKAPAEPPAGDHR